MRKRQQREREKRQEAHEILQKVSLTGDFGVQEERKGLVISGGFFPQKIRGESNKYFQPFLWMRTPNQKYPRKGKNE